MAEEGGQLKSHFEKSLDVALDAVPFQPFDVVLTSGDRYTVSSPYMLFMSGSIAFYYRTKSDRRDVLRVNQFAAIEFLDDTSA